MPIRCRFWLRSYQARRRLCGDCFAAFDLHQLGVFEVGEAALHLRLVRVSVAVFPAKRLGDQRKRFAGRGDDFLEYPVGINT